MRKYWIYEIRNIRNGKTYIGMSRCAIFGRIQEHLRLLKRGEHENSIFQTAWNESRGLPDWTFRLMERVDGIQSARRAEMKAISTVDPQFQLNIRKTAGVDWQTILDVKSMRKQGSDLKAISGRHGISVGTVSKIINSFPPYDIEE